MKLQTILFLILVSITCVAQNQDVRDQLELKFSKSYLKQLQVENLDKYNFHIAELKFSFEFVELEPGLDYEELMPYDFINKTTKDYPIFSEEKFSLYNYKFIRYKDNDVIYKIPGSNQGVLIYSKENFNSKI